MPRVTLDKPTIQYQRFCDWVKGELRRQGKEQADLAAYLNVSTPCISYRLNGKVEWYFRDVLKTVEFLGRDVTEIF